MMKKIVIVGASGMIGKALVQELHKTYNIMVVTRNVEKAGKLMGEKNQYVPLNNKDKLAAAISGAFCVINLAGKNIGDCKWNKKNKKEIIDSRVETGMLLTGIISALDKKPVVFVQASGISYYTNSFENIYNENSFCDNSGFLHAVTKKWEASTSNLDKIISRRIVLRTGIVIDKKEGAFPKILKPFKLFLGGKLGSGKQWFSWIHVKDVTRAIKFLIENNDSKGIYNLTAPEPVTNKEMARSIARHLKIPAWFNVPSFVIQLIYGQKGKETILSGQCVMPGKLIDEGFEFRFRGFDETLPYMFTQ